MAAGLGLYALFGVDQNHCHIGSGGSGNHVAGILFMAGGVGNNEFAFWSGEIPIGHVDGNTLFTLGGKAVYQQCQVYLFALGAVAPGVSGECGQLVVKDLLRLPEQASNQGAFAVVDAAAGDEAQSALRGLLGKPAMQLFGAVAHQKYPSCFFFSMDPALSVSILRPWRSDCRVLIISRKMSCRLAASDSTAPVSG